MTGGLSWDVALRPLETGTSISVQCGQMFFHYNRSRVDGLGTNREETHMEPENGRLGDYFPLQPSGFQVPC